MTLKLAAVQHFCGQVARAGGVWVDAFLTSLSPLTYERGDALMAFEEENEVIEPGGPWYQGLSEEERIGQIQGAIKDLYSTMPPGMFNGPIPDYGDLSTTSPDSPVGVSTSPLTVPPTGIDNESVVTPDHAAGVEASPTPPAAFKLPMYDAEDLEAIAAEYIDRGYPDGPAAKSRLVAQLIISHLTFELQSLVYDQNNQQ